MKIVKMKDNLFKEYDLRGIVGSELSCNDAYTLGIGLGSFIQNLGLSKILVGRDNRLSSKYLETNLINGLLKAGVDIVRLGLVTTPMVNVARQILDISCSIMITASHNPKEYNGFKIAFKKCRYAYGKELQNLKDFINNGEFKEGKGTVIDYDIKSEYLEQVRKSINLNKRLKVVIDCGNGVASIIVKDMLEMFDIDYYLLYCDSDGTFPNHHPDPSIEDNMKDLKNKVKELNYDLGIGIDGDGDRLAVIDNLGNYITTDYQLILMSKYLKPDKVLCEVKASRILKEELDKLNIKLEMYKTGSPLMTDKMQSDKILLGGEYSGHVFNYDNWYGIDDGLYNGLRFMEMLSNSDNNLNNLISKYPKYPNISYNYQVSDDLKFNLVNKIKDYVIKKHYKYNDIDGIRIEYDDAFVLIRASNTTPNLTIRIEANNHNRLDELNKEYFDLLDECKEGNYEE